MKNSYRLFLVASFLALPSWACTNFTGTWAGSCQTEGVDALQDDAVEILQTGCESIVVGNEKFEFGKESSYVENLESHNEKITVKADWNSAKTSFTISYGVTGTAVATDATLFTIKGSVNETLVDGKLVARLSEEEKTVGQPAVVTKSICTYRKPTP